MDPNFMTDEEVALNLHFQLNKGDDQQPKVIHNPKPNSEPLYKEVIQKVCRMPSDSNARSLCGKYGLQVATVSWEDSARNKNSSWGPCISDMTLEVEGHDVPVIRSPNYEDLTWDVPIEKIPLIVGNEHGDPNLRAVTLKEYLQNFRFFLHNPNEWKTTSTDSLFAPRDTHVIMSSQACFLPVPANGGEAKFNVSLFNYESFSRNPAVLVIVASSKGTSSQIVDSRKQKLFFNKNGERCSFLGERLSQHRVEQGKSDALGQPMTSEEKQQNMLLIIQVPLKVKRQQMRMEKSFGMMAESNLLFKCKRSMSEQVDVEDAILNIGDAEGPFREIDNLEIERNPEYPVRVTLQFYKATSNGEVNDKVIQDINQQLKDSRKYGENIGSLVVGGNTNRPTEHNNHPNQPLQIPPWWDDFWLSYKGLYPQFKSSHDAASLVFRNGRFKNSTRQECQNQVLDLLGNTNQNQPSWNVL